MATTTVIISDPIGGKRYTDTAASNSALDYCQSCGCYDGGRLYSYGPRAGDGALIRCNDNGKQLLGQSRRS